MLFVALCVFSPASPVCAKALQANPSMRLNGCSCLSGRGSPVNFAVVQTPQVWSHVSGDPYGEYLLMEAAAVRLRPSHLAVLLCAAWAGQECLLLLQKATHRSSALSRAVFASNALKLAVCVTGAGANGSSHRGNRRAPEYVCHCCRLRIARECGHQFRPVGRRVLGHGGHAGAALPGRTLLFNCLMAALTVGLTWPHTLQDFI